jgi:hypothetical protein
LVLCLLLRLSYTLFSHPHPSIKVRLGKHRLPPFLVHCAWRPHLQK